MSSPARLSDFEDDLLPNDRIDVDDLDGGGYRSDGAIEDTNAQNDENEGSSKRRIDPKTSQKRTIRNPQPRLNAELLKGQKGIQTIEQYFEDFKFRGKGHEKKDLQRLMKKLEYWSHRLFPKFQFDDSLAKLETLGNKKPVQTHLTKIRLGTLVNDDVVQNNIDDENEDVVQDSVPINDFDALIAEELQKKQSTMSPQRENVSFLSNASNETPSTTADPLPKVPAQTSHIEITSEMKDRIERNRQIAIQKRLARIDAEEAKKKALQEQEEKNEEPMDQDKDKQTSPEESMAVDSMEEK